MPAKHYIKFIISTDRERGRRAKIEILKVTNSLLFGLTKLF